MNRRSGDRTSGSGHATARSRTLSVHVVWIAQPFGAAAAMLTATCHCGAVCVEVPRKPRILTACNCSICVRYGALWAYYRPGAIRVIAARGASESYAWSRKSIRFVRCRTCGCVTHYERTSANARYGAVNARGFPLDVLESIRVRRLDGARTWKYLD